MIRRLVVVVCAVAVAVCVGCGDSGKKDTNPNNLPYGKGEPLPKRDAPAPKAKKGR